MNLFVGQDSALLDTHIFNIKERVERFVSSRSKRLEVSFALLPHTAEPLPVFLICKVTRYGNDSRKPRS